jgi:hypothetical protein
MIPFSPPPYGRARLALFGAALSLTALGCGADAPVTPSDDSASGDEKDNDDSDDSEPGNTGAKDAGKATATKDAGKKDAGASAPSGDAGGGDKSPTKPAIGSSLWCDALKVFEDKCQSCHGASTAAGAPMSLVTFADTIAPAPVSKGKKVYEAVAVRIHDAKNPMPPGMPLTAAELAPIDAWIKDGATMDESVTCEQKDEPGSVAEDWPPAGCDQSYKILAGGGSPVMVGKGAEIHPQYTFDAPWGDEDVQAIAFRPITDNTKVLHHWILYDNGGSGTFLSGWAPGQDGTKRKPLPDDVAFFVPKGPKSLRLDLHYNNLAGTKAELDQSGLEVCVTKQKRANLAATFMGFAGIPFIAPGQETDIVGTCNVKVTQPVFLMAESPHAHKLATHMKFEVKSGGKTTVLHDAAFAFDGQVATPLKELLELKDGDQVITTCHFKNDTNQLVTFGENTGNEMCFNFATYYPMGALSCNGQAPIDVGSAFGGTPSTGS